VVGTSPKDTHSVRRVGGSSILRCDISNTNHVPSLGRAAYLQLYQFCSMVPYLGREDFKLSVLIMPTLHEAVRI